MSSPAVQQLLESISYPFLMMWLDAKASTTAEHRQAADPGTGLSEQF